MTRLRLAATGLAAALIMIIGGVYYGPKGEEIRKNTVEEVYTSQNEGGTAVNGPSNGTNTGPRGSQEVSEPVQGSLGSGKDLSETVPRPMEEAPATGEAVSRGGNRATGDDDNYNSLGTFKVTAYTAGYESTGKRPGHPEYGITATGATVEEGFTIAADWKVLKPGTVVYIEGVGERTVQDRGGAVKGQHIDLYIADLDEALTWGVQKREVFLIEEGGR